MRVQVMMSDKMVQRVDELANDLGMSRSATCNMLISQGVMSYEKTSKAMSTLPSELVEKLLKNIPE